jgi:hypothetical protein
MKRLALSTIAILLALAAARAAFVLSDATYVSTFGPECITVRDSMSFVVRDFLEKHPGCRTVATGNFQGAAYVHNECGDSHIVTGSHVVFDGNAACEAFASLSAEERLRAVGDHLGGK